MSTNHEGKPDHTTNQHNHHLKTHTDYANIN